MTTLKDIPTLAAALRDRASRFHDRTIPFRLFQAVPDKVDVTVDGDGNPMDIWAPVFQARVKEGHAPFTARIMPQVISQIAAKTAEKKQGGGTKTMLPGPYIRNLLDVGGEDAAVLNAQNINFWLRRHDGETHRDRARTPKGHLLRLQADRAIKDQQGRLLPAEAEAAVWTARALLSDRYFPIDNLSLAVVLVQVITGKWKFNTDENAEAGDVINFADGVRCFDWRLGDKGMDICLMNPSMCFDLNNPEAGVMQTTPVNDGFAADTPDGSHGWVTPTGKTFRWGSDKNGDDGSHLVFPAARIQNSETGHGGMEIIGGFFEAICNNKAMMGTNVLRRHLGALMDGSAQSQLAHQKRTEVVMAEVADGVRHVFDPEPFETMCQKFLGLFDEEVEADKVQDAFQCVVELPGGADLLQGALMHYAPVNPGKHTVGDVQRAVTRVAQDVEDMELQAALEDLGGKIVKEGRKLLKV